MGLRAVFKCALRMSMGDCSWPCEQARYAGSSLPQFRGPFLPWYSHWAVVCAAAIAITPRKSAVSTEMRIHISLQITISLLITRALAPKHSISSTQAQTKRTGCLAEGVRESSDLAIGPAVFGQELFVVQFHSLTVLQLVIHVVAIARANSFGECGLAFLRWQFCLFLLRFDCALGVS